VPTLPNVTSKFVLDYSDLTKAEKASAKAHGEFQSGAKASTTHNLRFEQSLTTLMDHFGGMPPIVNQAGRSIESMASQGVSGMTMLGGAALVAVGAVAEVIGTSIKAYADLGEKVENYKRVVGGSAEESSRMVETFNALGVGADTATGGMFKLSKAIELTPKKLTDLGVVIAHDAAGNVDLSKTLFSVADAYNATASQTQKNLIVFDAFGKSGKDMIPILEQGSAALKQLEADASMVFTQADLDRLKQTQIHTKEVQNSWDAMWASIGQKFIPVQDALSESILRGEYVQKRLNEAVASGAVDRHTFIQDQYTAGTASNNLNNAWDKQFDASQKLKTAIDSQAQATQDAAAANDALWTSADKLISQEEAQVNAGFALQLAQLAVTESQGKVDQANQRVVQSADAVGKAQDAVAVALANNGRGSEEYKQAVDNLTTAQLAQNQTADDVQKAQIEQEKAYYAVAAAARKLQEDTDLATTGSKNATKETNAYVDSLQAEANSLAPDSPLRKRLQNYIDTLKNEIPATVSTKFITDYVTTGTHPGGHGSLSFAGGGRPPVGVPSLVGEKGPEIWTPDEPGTITPHGATPPAPPGGGGNHYTLTLVGAPVVNDPEGVRRMLMRMQYLGPGT
jgi:hypothetical protein